jgi:hypothetical protein
MTHIARQAQWNSRQNPMEIGVELNPAAPDRPSAVLSPVREEGV